MKLSDFGDISNTGNIVSVLKASCLLLVFRLLHGPQLRRTNRAHVDVY
jgi:hypothetical protein